MFGFYRLAAAVPKVFLANPEANTRDLIRLYKEAADQRAAAVVFPEMCITGYTIGDLVFQKQLLQAARSAALKIAENTAGKSCIAIVGMPLEVNGKLYNTALVIQNGSIVAAVPKQQLPNYREFHEKRFFA